MHIGFSTGAVAFGDFRLGVERLAGHRLYGIELSALRVGELAPLISALDDLNLDGYEYISFHAPSQFNACDEASVVRQLEYVVQRGWPIVCHPDSIQDAALWKRIEPSLCFENMDKRKPIGRTAVELKRIFGRFPRSALCFDLGHACQVDRTMSEAKRIIREYRGRIRQVHISEVNTKSEHGPMTLASATAYAKVVEDLPDDVPYIIESVVLSPHDIGREIAFVNHFFGEITPRLVTD